MDKEFEFEIVKYLGILSTNKNGWTKEFNLVSWSGGKPKYDIRSWDHNHNRMSKGVSFNEEEIQILNELLNRN